MRLIGILFQNHSEVTSAKAEKLIESFMEVSFMERSFTIPISRRDLLKLAGVTAVGAVLSGKHEVEAAEKISGDTISYNGKKIPVLY